MLGNGQSVDVLKLYLVVREKGGYEIVSKNGLWESVAKESGFDATVASSLKLVYVKYLDTLDRWLRRTAKVKHSKGGLVGTLTDKDESSMDFELEFKGIFSEITGGKKDGEHLHIDLEESKMKFIPGEKACNVGEIKELAEGIENCGDKTSISAVKCNTNVKSSVVEEDDFNRSKCKGDEVRSLVELDGDKENGNHKKRSVNDDKCEMDIESSVVMEAGCDRKRKRESFSELLNWAKKVAKDPCDPAIGSLPERLKWKSCGNEQLWRQVLLAREAILLKRIVDSSSDPSIWQKKQKMHPSMYEDHPGLERSRCSQRILSAKESGGLLSLKRSRERACSEPLSSGTEGEDDSDKQSDPLVGLWISNHSRRRIPVGPHFQVKVPEWTGETCESESKWLGERFWPLEKEESCKKQIERDRIGKGGQDSCGCQFPSSLECVRFHVTEKRMRVKLELGLAFYRWHIDRMGEEVALSWAQEDEKKFEDTVRLNPLTEDKCFWDEILKVFPDKSRGQLVSYYFNVFLHRKRGCQNRATPIEINSDDDEPEFGSTINESGEGVNSPASIYCSSKKGHLNFSKRSKAV